MGTRWFTVLAVIAALGLVTPALKADHGEGKGKGHAHFDDDDKDNDRDEQWEHRDGYENGLQRRLSMSRASSRKSNR